MGSEMCIRDRLKQNLRQGRIRYRFGPPRPSRPKRDRREGHVPTLIVAATTFSSAMPASDANSSADDFDQHRRDAIKAAPIPLLWLFGKTGSGKSSIIRMLTGASEAEIGNGFRPQTKSSMQFDFPDDQTPIARFLDTRGIGEAGYDAAVDLAATIKVGTWPSLRSRLGLLGLGGPSRYRIRPWRRFCLS